MIDTDEAGQPDEIAKNRGEDVVATRVGVENVDDEEVRRVPEHRETGRQVGDHHTRQDEVGLGPESWRQPDREQRKPVAAHVEYVVSG